MVNGHADRHAGTGIFQKNSKHTKRHLACVHTKQTPHAGRTLIRTNIGSGASTLCPVHHVYASVVAYRTLRGASARPIVTTRTHNPFGSIKVISASAGRTSPSGSRTSDTGTRSLPAPRGGGATSRRCRRLVNTRSITRPSASVNPESPPLDASSRFVREIGKGTALVPIAITRTCAARNGTPRSPRVTSNVRVFADPAHPCATRPNAITPMLPIIGVSARFVRFAVPCRTQYRNSSIMESCPRALANVAGHPCAPLGVLINPFQSRAKTSSSAEAHDDNAAQIGVPHPAPPDTAEVPALVRPRRIGSGTRLHINKFLFLRKRKSPLEVSAPITRSASIAA